ncbi:type II toxin-antitoxin system VapC family toxin [Cyanobium sp. WAJ14-Wanaka]|uniref:type II toxin-antitoxin system VapC family toxin n=1 Tax=Cyanobium sp. WAJ14-Wanaka TaxID=2823725 RepID=UPI0020CB7FF6|nr:type II toxin-antitoxin system VapC family toxin [Cyanobium sp. WAJ14-Wanaka]MCP9776090.1 type II toxin-antitoxin system VapC family toxin [Cyanobium sp. WAJ14-Wanaka]
MDASVLFGWFANCSSTAQALAVLEHTTLEQRIAPDLVLIELLNAGWKSNRAGAITSQQFEAMATLTPQLLGEITPSASLMTMALRWCRELDHPAYDCLYLALAEQRQATLITADQRLLKRLQIAGASPALAVDLNQWQAPTRLTGAN